MSENIIKRPLSDEKGAALLLVLVMLTALLGAAGWLAMQTRTETAIATAIKDYSKSFNAGDGSLQVSVYYLRHIANPTNESASWNPKKVGGGEVGVTSTYSSFINDTVMQQVVGSNDNVESMAKVIWLNYSSIPPPGWGLSDKGYGNKFVAYQYKAVGDGKLKFALSNGTTTDRATSRVSALLLRIGS